MLVFPRAVNLRYPRFLRKILLYPFVTVLAYFSGEPVPTTSYAPLPAVSARCFPRVRFVPRCVCEKLKTIGSSSCLTLFMKSRHRQL